MSKMSVDRKMKRGDFEYLYSHNVACCKWLDRHSVTMLFSNAEGIATTSTVPHRQKGSASNIQVSCPDVIKMYNKGMVDVDLIDQRAAAYHLDRKSTLGFYLHIFFDLMDVVCANSFIVYNLMHPNDLTMLDFKKVVSTYLTGIHKSKKSTTRWENRFQKKVSLSV